MRWVLQSPGISGFRKRIVQLYIVIWNSRENPSQNAALWLCLVIRGSQKRSSAQCTSISIYPDSFCDTPCTQRKHSNIGNFLWKRKHSRQEKFGQIEERICTKEFFSEKNLRWPKTRCDTACNRRKHSNIGNFFWKRKH